MANHGRFRKILLWGAVAIGGLFLFVKFIAKPAGGASGSGQAAPYAFGPVGIVSQPAQSFGHAGHISSGAGHGLHASAQGPSNQQVLNQLTSLINSKKIDTNFTTIERKLGAGTPTPWPRPHNATDPLSRTKKFGGTMPALRVP